MLIWQAKTTSGGSYTNMKTPSTYKHNLEDLDKDSYRSVASGNLIDNVISNKWTKIEMTYNHLTKAEVYSLLAVLKANPIYVTIQDHPLYNANQEMEMRCSKVDYEMLENHNYTMSFNLVQKKKVTGQ